MLELEFFSFLLLYLNYFHLRVPPLLLRDAPPDTLPDERIPALLPDERTVPALLDVRT